jgi:ATP-binding cassette subfamily A (ABC1) protein 3
MLSGEIKPSSGECFVMGCSLLNDLSTARTFLGYCPQFDALLDKLTVFEHLQLYCSIKGIPEKTQASVIEKTLS